MKICRKKLHQYDSLSKGCPKCRKEYNKIYHQTHPKSPEKKKSAQKRWAAKNSAYFREWNLKHKYGMTQKEYDSMASKQNDRCLICNIDNKVLAVDHCHVTGKVRGLLCMQCNAGIGNFKENIVFFENAILYLKLNKL